MIKTLLYATIRLLFWTGVSFYATYRLFVEKNLSEYPTRFWKR